MKNYVCATIDGGFFLAKGEPLEDDKTLALVRSWSEPIVTPRWFIIDIASGLFVCRGTAKKKVLEIWNQRKENYFERIEKARSKDVYKARCEQLEVEEHIWRESGYIIRGELK